MVTTIKKGASKEIIEKSLKRTGTQKGFDANKHFNTLKIDKNPIEIQKRLRNEWQ